MVTKKNQPIPRELLPLLSQQINYKNKIKNAIIVLFLLLIFSPLVMSMNHIKTGNVAKINLYGTITFDNKNQVSAKQIIKYLNEIENRNVRALILDINSPGGGASATYMIVKKIEELKQKKNITVIALINEIGTSGAYWIATTADKIYCNKLSIVGSIGVTSAYLTFENLLKQYNITYERLIAGKYKDLGSPFKELTKNEKELLMKKINLTYDFFIDSVSKNRQMNMNQVKKLATGEYYIGITAKKLGLIDDFGTYNDVIKYLNEKLNETIYVDNYAPEKSLFQQLTGLSSKMGFKFGQGLLESLKTKKEQLNA